jgi:hypothetical protein
MEGYLIPVYGIACFAIGWVLGYTTRVVFANQK